jgi:hypothetical protein
LNWSACQHHAPLAFAVIVIRWRATCGLIAYATMLAMAYTADVLGFTAQWLCASGVKTAIADNVERLGTERQ